MVDVAPALPDPAADVAPVPAAPPRAPAAPPRALTARLVSLDVFRGVTMVFMASEILNIAGVARKFPGSAFAHFLVSNLDHREWVGCAPWDLIQPAFMFMVGVALPFSLAKRSATGKDRKSVV